VTGTEGSGTAKMARERRRWRGRGGYLAAVILVGLVGGVAMAAVASARRTQSVFPA
jgi:hypothetical protein